MLRPNGSLARNDLIMIKCAACGATVCVKVHEMARLCIEKMAANAENNANARTTD